MIYTPQNITDIRILIIDSNRDFANVFAKLLKIKGFSVTVETTFETGLRHLKHKLCDIVFVDIPLEGYDEKQILNLLKENEMFKKLKVFLFSSIDLDKTELDEWEKEGLYLYLKKPIKRDVVIKALEDVRAKLNFLASQTHTDSIVDSNESTSEQLSRLNDLQKQIRKLESHPESTTEPETPLSPRGSLPKDSTGELPQELDLASESVHTMNYSVLKNIISNLRLQSTLKPAEYNLMNLDIENNDKDKEIIKKEIEKIQLEISTLKNKVLLFNSTESQESQSIQKLSMNRKHKIKKNPSGTNKKHKIKKKHSGTKTKNTK